MPLDFSESKNVLKVFDNDDLELELISEQSLRLMKCPMYRKSRVHDGISND